MCSGIRNQEKIIDKIEEDMKEQRNFLNKLREDKFTELFMKIIPGHLLFNEVWRRLSINMEQSFPRSLWIYGSYDGNTPIRLLDELDLGLPCNTDYNLRLAEEYHFLEEENAIK